MGIFKKLSAVGMAAALAVSASVCAFAEDVSSQDPIGAVEYKVDGSKGTYTLNDKEFKAMAELTKNIHGEGEKIDNSPMQVIGSGSKITVTNDENSKVKFDEIYGTRIWFIDVQKDSDGNTTMNWIGNCEDGTSIGTPAYAWVLHPEKVDESVVNFKGDACVFGNSITYDQLMDYRYRYINGSLIGYDGYIRSEGIRYDEEISAYNGEIDLITKDGYYDMSDADETAMFNSAKTKFDELGVDMILIDFYYAPLDVIDNKFDGWKTTLYVNGDGFYMDPETEEMKSINDFSRINTLWYVTEAGMKVLGGETPVDPPVTEGTYKVTANEAISSADFAAVLEANKTQDVEIKSGDVTFTFKKGDMKAVDGVSAYDFGAKLSTDNKDKIDGFVCSIDYNYSGNLPAKADIKINVGKDYAGKTLYYSQLLDSKLTFVQSAKVDADGYITISQDHCSTYVLTSTDPTKKPDDSGKVPATGVTVFGFGLAAMALAGAAAASRKRR